jgi:hypothetical protein
MANSAVPVMVQENVKTELDQKSEDDIESLVLKELGGDEYQPNHNDSIEKSNIPKLNDAIVINEELAKKEIIKEVVKEEIKPEIKETSLEVPAEKPKETKLDIF